nr:tetratricopeptide repeat protein [Parvularcula dongshanensis]
MALYLNVPLSFAQLSLLLDDERNAAHYIVGAITAAYDQPALSAAALDQVEETSWLYNYAVIDRADALLDLGREDEAISLLTDYAKQDALAPDVYLRLADLYASDDRWDQSARAATEAIRIVETLSSDDTRAQNLWRYRFARGVGYVDAGDWPKGEEDLQAALTLAPDEPLVLNYLGYSYVERGERLEEALSMIERALELEPNSGAITDSLGWAHYQLGNYEQAVEYLERAVELEPGDDVITDHLGDAYWQLGRHKEASFEWRRVLEIEELTPELRNTVRGKLTGDAPAPGALAHLDRDV